MNSVIKKRKLNNQCPICGVPLPGGDMPQNSKWVIEKMGNENIGIAVCNHHYVADCFLEQSRADNYEMRAENFKSQLKDSKI